MPSILSVFRKIIFYSSLAFLLISVLLLIVGHFFPFEFADRDMGSKLHVVLMFGLPLAIMLTLFGSIRATNKFWLNMMIIVATILGCCISFYAMLLMAFSYDFNSIRNTRLLYQQIGNPEIRIVEQEIGQGALGEDGIRIVKLQPFLKYWNKTTLIDTASLNSTEWIYVNKRLDK